MLGAFGERTGGFVSNCAVDSQRSPPLSEANPYTPSVARTRLAPEGAVFKSRAARTLPPRVRAADGGTGLMGCRLRAQVRRSQRSLSIGSCATGCPALRQEFGPIGDARGAAHFALLAVHRKLGAASRAVFRLARLDHGARGYPTVVVAHGP